MFKLEEGRTITPPQKPFINRTNNPFKPKDGVPLTPPPKPAPKPTPGTRNK